MYISIYICNLQKNRHFLEKKKTKKTKKPQKKTSKIYGKTFINKTKIIHIILVSCDFLGFWRTKMKKWRNIFYFYEILGRLFLKVFPPPPFFFVESTFFSCFFILW